MMWPRVTRLQRRHYEPFARGASQALKETPHRFTAAEENGIVQTEAQAIAYAILAMCQVYYDI